jgi:glucokinase
MTAAGADRLVLALDVGGTKLAAGVVTGEGTVLTRRRRATPVTRDPEVLWRAVVALLEHVTHGTGAPRYAGVGAGCGGPMRWPEGEVSPLNIPAWSGFPLRQRLEERFGVPVRLHNDAVCVAVAEHWLGAGRGRGNVLGMVVSTGVGGGLVLDGHLVAGGSGNAGHVGHLVVDPAGPPCACGGRGCLEAVASGPRLTAWAREQGWRAAASSGSGPTMPPPTARDLADDARAGEPVALQAMRRAGSALGVAFASSAAVCDLDVVAVGGGLMGAWDLLARPLHDTLRRYARLDFTRDLRVVPADLGVDVGLVGAAALHLRGDAYWPVAP